MTNALTILTPNDIMTTARAFIASGFLPRSLTTVEQVFTVIMMSQELQIGTWQGINGINIIQGKPTVSPQLMLALINRSGQLEDMQITATADAATVVLKRRGRTPHTEVFSIKDAAAQGLTGKDNYKKQPATMLKWRAVAAAARVVFPDVIMGLYMTEELAPDETTVNENGESTYTAVTVERPAQPEQIAAPAPMTVDPAPAAEFERRDVTVKSVKRVAVQGGKPVWGFRGYDYSGAEYRFSIESRDSLGDAKEQASAWNTTVGSVTELDKPLDMTIEHEGGYWYFVAVNS